VPPRRTRCARCFNEPAQSWLEALSEQFEKTPPIVARSLCSFQGKACIRHAPFALRHTSVTASCAPIFAPLTTGGAFQRAEEPAPLLAQLRADRHSAINNMVI
jgi:hypothetical protein